MDLFGFEDDETLDNIHIIPETKIQANKPLQPEPKSQMSISQIQELLLSELNASETTINSSLSETSIYVEDSESVAVPPKTRRVRAVELNGLTEYDTPLTNDNVSEIPKLQTRPRRVVRQKKVLHDENFFITDETVSEFVVPKSRSRGAVLPKKAVQNENAVKNDNINEPPVLRSRPQRAAKQKKTVLDEKKSSMNDSVSDLKCKVTRAYAKPVRQKKQILGEIQNTYFVDNTVDTTIVKRKRDVKKKTKAQNNAEIENEHIDHMAEEINNKFKQIEEFQLLVE